MKKFIIARCHLFAARTRNLVDKQYLLKFDR